MSTPEIVDVIFNADQPARLPEADRIGVIDFADHLLSVIKGHVGEESVVIGVEGPWGSGKSTIVQHIRRAVLGDNQQRSRFRHVSSNYLVVTFQPWLIGNREGLLAAFFSELLLAFEQAANHDSFMGLGGDEQLPRLLSLLRTYVGAIAQLGPPAEAAAKLSGHPIIGALAKALFGSLGALLKTSVSDTKIEIDAALRRQSRRVLIFIDDLDRLDPSELAEVIRLVRSVADFANITYVLSYDPRIVSEALSTALKLDGQTYLQKIVQIRFSVPEPEDFDLRTWLRDAITGLSKSALHPWEEDVGARLANTIMGRVGQQLKTPRDVIRTINAFTSIRVLSSVSLDAADALWLSIMETSRPRMVEWFRSYMKARNQMDLGATLLDEEKIGLSNKLTQSMLADRLSPDEAKSLLSYVLPWVSGFSFSQTDPADTQSWDLFKKASSGVTQELERERRISHPRFTRTYFAFTGAKGALSLDFESRLEGALSTPDTFSEWISSEKAVLRPQGGAMSDYIVQQIAERVDSLSVEQLKNVALGLASVMDEAVDGQPLGEWGRHWIWVSAGLILSAYFRMARRDAVSVTPVVERIFGEGDALGWLAWWHRDEAQSAEKESSQAALEPQDLGLATSLLLRRYRSSTISLASRPQFLRLLYDWKAAGDLQGARKWVEENTRLDADLLRVIEGLRGWAAVNGVPYRPIRRDDVSTFLDYTNARRRVNLLAQVEGPLRAQASELALAFEQGEEKD